MNTTQSLITAPPQSLILASTPFLLAALNNPDADLIQPDAIAKRDDLIAQSEATEQVAGEASQQAAVDMRGRIQKALNYVEKERKTTKDPFLRIGKAIDKAVAEYIRKLDSEDSRLQGMLGKWNLAQQAIADKARQAQEAELAKLQAERRAAELVVQHAANAKQQEEAQAAILPADLKAAATVMAAPVVAPKAEGSKVTIRWVTTVTDPAALYKAFPEFVNIVPKMGEINKAVTGMATLNPNQEPKLPGCTCVKEIDVTGTRR